MTEKKIRLTAYTACAGCAAKTAAGDLLEVLAVLKSRGPAAAADLLVGLEKPDDAAVYRIAPDLAIVGTVDFFPPVVDDPYTWGAVAAANAMSDVYAMGGEVLFALAVAGFPREMPGSVVAEVFRGGAEKVAEAGGVIAGGHTVVDPEPKYGLCVTGRVHPERIFVKGALEAGDRLFLSKPLGTGVITTAAKEGAAPEDVLASAVASMLRLNRVAAEVARDVGAVAVTDVTGFGLLGHAAEMVQASAAGIALEASRLPLVPGARALAEKGHFSGAMKRNRRHVEAVLGPGLRIHPAVPDPLGALLFESETSGGLLFSVADDRAPEVVPRFARHGARCWEIGIVAAAPTITVTP
jgi:selenide, water dikinase